LFKKKLFNLRFEWSTKAKLLIVQPGGTHCHQHVLNVLLLYGTQSHPLQIRRLRLIFISIRRSFARQEFLKTRMKIAKREEMSRKKMF